MKTSRKCLRCALTGLQIATAVALFSEGTTTLLLLGLALSMFLIVKFDVVINTTGRAIIHDDYPGRWSATKHRQIRRATFGDSAASEKFFDLVEHLVIVASSAAMIVTPGDLHVFGLVLAGTYVLWLSSRIVGYVFSATT